MKPLTIFILALSLASLACLQTAIVADSPPEAPTQTAMLQETSEPESGAVFEPETWNVEPETRTCAIVTAIQSLNLREQPSEKAIVINWLQAKQIVQIIGRVGDWWKVEADGRTGYARAKYLQETECK